MTACSGMMNNTPTRLDEFFFYDGAEAFIFICAGVNSHAYVCVS